MEDDSPQKLRRKLFEILTYGVLVSFSLITLIVNRGQLLYETDIILIFLVGYTLVLVLPVSKFELGLGGFRGEMSIKEQPADKEKKEIAEKVSKVVPKIAQLIREGKNPDVPGIVADALKQDDLVIDSTPLDPQRGRIWFLHREDFDTAQELLDRIWLSLPHDIVRPYTYGKTWVLRETSPEKRVLWNMGSGSTVAREFEGRRRDTRRLDDVGIGPGTKLEVVRPSDVV